MPYKRVSYNRALLYLYHRVLLSLTGILFKILPRILLQERAEWLRLMFVRDANVYLVKRSLESHKFASTYLKCIFGHKRFRVI